MTIDFPEPLTVRAHVRAGELKYSSQVPVTSWADIGVSGRKWAVRKAKAQLFQRGALCASCADVVDPDARDCTLCSPARLGLWDGGREYPLTGDMLRVYSTSARFNLVATLRDHPTVYAGLELPGPEWENAGLEQRHQLMCDVVDRFLGLYGGADLGAVRTFIWDGDRQNGYGVNWPAVLDDQSR
ncbi:hypothetical protein AB0H51_28180 [Streptomyces griseoluteus]|uniref:hypothetical protein n=1 Tax=Streptomyces griseoluteus TaxID=29306 RepID=UPI0033EE4752